MDLPRDALADVFWPIVNMPSDATAVELQLGYGAQWLPMTVINPTTVSVYLAGPDVASPGSAVVVSADTNCRIRVRSAHYTVPVRAGSLHLVTV